ncbi:MAG: hypothetical protein HY825_08535 [Acidobacteria bacterium]|nr:hypothetical protein [Acidobacteriota bacterium]
MNDKRIAAAAIVLGLLPLASAFGGIERLKFKPAAAAAVRLGEKNPISCAPLPGSASVRVARSVGPPLPAGTRVGFRYMREKLVDRGGVNQAVLAWTEVEADLETEWLSGTSNTREWEAPGIHQEPCTAWYYGGLPDLEPLKTRVAQGRLILSARNNNRLTRVPPAKLMVRGMRCDSPVAVFTQTSWVFPGMAPGQIYAELNFALPGLEACHYFDVKMDWERKVLESNEDNNTLSGAEICPLLRLPPGTLPSVP